MRQRQIEGGGSIPHANAFLPSALNIASSADTDEFAQGQLSMASRNPQAGRVGVVVVSVGS